MNKVMMIGAVRAGKSTLTKALLNESVDTAVKTQALNYESWIIDTPGEYLENPMFYKSIIATSLEATHVIYLQDATRINSNFPPNFSSGISKWPIGVVTKAFVEGANVEQAIWWLKQVVGQAPIVVTSAKESDLGIAHIHALVACNNLEEMREYVAKHQDDYLFFT